MGDRGNGAMHMSDDRPVLTYSQVREWQHRVGEIAVQVMALQEESATLIRKLEAAKVIMGDLPSDEIGNAARMSLAATLSDKERQPEDQSLSDAVLKAVDALRGAPKAGQIKQWIIEHGIGEAVEKVTQPYFYTILMRHARTGRLIKDRDGYRYPASSPKGEAGEGGSPAGSVT